MSSLDTDFEPVVAKPVVPRRISSMIESFIEDSLDRRGFNEHVSYEIQMGMTQAGPQAVIVFFINGPVLGSMLSAMSIIENPPKVTFEEIDKLVYEVLEELREERSKLLS